MVVSGVESRRVRSLASVNGWPDSRVALGLVVGMWMVALAQGGTVTSSVRVPSDSCQRVVTRPVGVSYDASAQFRRPPGRGLMTRSRKPMDSGDWLMPATSPYSHSPTEPSE